MDILTEITTKRRADIEQKGFTFGHSIPEKRQRAIVPFLPEPGTILEIKRASPSKGWIAPQLDSAETAKSYVNAGTSAISVLTEENYFHGTLDDLQKAAKAAGEKTAILRKDFLLEPEEIEIAYKCGADAVLLIGRILEKEKMLEMAEKAFTLGISILLEIREDSDIEKAFYVLELADKMNCNEKIVLGINSRDLATFTIDLLIPLRLKEKIKKVFVQKKADFPLPRIISESGVTSPKAASFVGNLGFHGVLIGEAAARNPEMAKELVKEFVKGSKSDFGNGFNPYEFWKQLSEKLEMARPEIDSSPNNDSNLPQVLPEQNLITEYRPLIKICGLREKEDALKAAELGADFLGFIFAEKSARTNSVGPDTEEKISTIREELKKICLQKNTAMPLMIGVIVDPASEHGKFAISLCKKGILDSIQFHGCSIEETECFGYAAVPLAEEADLDIIKSLYSIGFPRVLIDAKNLDASNASGDVRYGGTGKTIPAELVAMAKKLGPLWLSGGVTPENLKVLVNKFKPELIDICSGVEKEPGKKDWDKLMQVFETRFSEGE